MRADTAGRIVRTLSPPEVLTDAFDRMLAVSQRVQLAVGAVALAAVWVIPPERGHAQVVVTALLIALYLPWAILSPRLARLGDGLAARALNLTLDLAAVGVFALLLPFARVAVMLAFTLVVAFHAYVSGRIAGLAMSAAAVAVIGVAEWRTPPAGRFDTFTLVMFTVLLAALAVMVDALAAERRRTSRHLGRLLQALGNLAADPSLAGAADSIAAAARRAVDATGVAVLLPAEDGGATLEVAGGSGVPDDLRDLLGRRSSDPERSPTGAALRDGRPVAVRDVTTDRRTAWAGSTLVAHGIRSLVAIPLGPPSQPIGVLVASFDRVGAADDDDVHLLTAYARQASIAVARILGFEQERRAAERVAQADQLKSDFVSTVSHELRTPLTSISGFIDTVLLQWDRLGDDVKKETLQRAAWNAGELRRLIEQVLDFAAVEATDALGHRSPFRLRDELDDLVRHMAPALRECEVVVDVDPELVVSASREAIQHVVGNLLTNASKFSPSGSTIRIDGRRDGPVACLAVSDEGPGVAEADRDRIFERFYRGTTTPRTRGTGIGLAIVRTSVEKLGGSVALRPGGHGEGATFEVTLPLAEDAVVAPLAPR